MNIYYHAKYNISLGLLNYLHPFKGDKFSTVYKEINSLDGISIKSPEQPVQQEVINQFAGDLLVRLLPSKRYILNALEVPYIPLVPFSLIDKRILLPMRWGVAGTIAAATDALDGNHTWNMSGGYHHASPSGAEGFCIYNDIGIAYQELTRQSLLGENDKVLIIDIDAHHGNGNAATFMENNNIVLLDIYNNDIYPTGQHTKDRVDVNIPLRYGTAGKEYLTKLENGLNQLDGNYKIAFVVAGTDVLDTDPLGGLKLSIEECVTRDKMVMDKLAALSVPVVFLGGGGYSKESAKAITQSIMKLYKL